MDLARRGPGERARRPLDGFFPRAHLAAAGEAEIDFCRVRMAVVRTDLAGLPAGHGVVAVLDLAENLLDVLLGIPLLLFCQAERFHGLHAPRCLDLRCLATNLLRL